MGARMPGRINRKTNTEKKNIKTRAAEIGVEIVKA
jgi:hypothetical protein